MRKEAGGTVWLTVQAPPELRPQVAKALVGAGMGLLWMDRGSQKLESIFLKLTHGKEMPS